MAAIFHTTFWNGFSWMKMYEFREKISLKFVPRGPINNMPALGQIMAWRRPGDKPLTEPMMVRLLTHVCVTRPQWVKLPFQAAMQVVIDHTLHPLFLFWQFCNNHPICGVTYNECGIYEIAESALYPLILSKLPLPRVGFSKSKIDLGLILLGHDGGCLSVQKDYLALWYTLSYGKLFL